MSNSYHHAFLPVIDRDNNIIIFFVDHCMKKNTDVFGVRCDDTSKPTSS